MECSLHNYRLFAGPLFDEEAHRGLAESNYERNWNPLVTLFLPTCSHDDRTRSHRRAQVNIDSDPRHSRSKDTLVQVDGGEATAAAVKDSRLVIFDEMGHEMPEILWCDITTEILNHVRATESA